MNNQVKSILDMDTQQLLSFLQNSSHLLAEINCLTLARGAQDLALTFDDIKLEKRIAYAKVALTAWEYLRKNKEMQGQDPTLCSELLLRAEVLRRFGERPASDILSREQLVERLETLLSNIDSDTLRRSAADIDRDLANTDKETLRDLRLAKNWLNAVHGYLISFHEELPDRLRWWLDRKAHLP